MRPTFTALMAVGFLALGCTSLNRRDLTYQIPIGWREEQTNKESYILLTSHAGGELAMYRQNPDGKARQATKAPGPDFPSQGIYPIQSFAGDSCHGSYEPVAIGGDRLSVMILLNVKGDHWSGRFVGSKDDWIHALTLLKTFRKNG